MSITRKRQKHPDGKKYFTVVRQAPATNLLKEDHGYMQVVFLQSAMLSSPEEGSFPAFHIFESYEEANVKLQEMRLELQKNKNSEEAEKLRVGCIAISNTGPKLLHAPNKDLNIKKLDLYYRLPQIVINTYPPDAPDIVSSVKEGLVYLHVPKDDKSNRYNHVPANSSLYFPKSYYNLLSDVIKKNPKATDAEKIAALFADYEEKGSFKRHFFNTFFHGHWFRKHTDMAKNIVNMLQEDKSLPAEDILYHLALLYVAEDIVYKRPVAPEGSFGCRLDCATAQLTHGEYSSIKDYIEKNNLELTLKQVALDTAAKAADFNMRPK